MEQNREMGALEVLQLLPHDAEIQNAVGNYQQAPQPPIHQCPRCFSMDTKFCYYNNYNVNQPRHFCKECRRYWTVGGSIRDIPIGGTSRRGKKPFGVYPQWNALPASATIVPGPMPSLMSTEPGTIDALPFQIFPHAHPALMSDSGSLSAAHRMRPVSLLGLTDPELTLLGGLSNPYEFSNMMGSDFALSGDLNLPPSGLQQQEQQQQINCSQGNYLDGSEMPISQQFANEQSLVFSNMHPTGPLMSQQSLNIGNDVLDPEAVLLCGYRNYAMGGSTMDPICWSLFPEFGPFV